MEFFSSLFDLILHLDRHLASLIESYGLWTYLILFLIVFAETGLVVTPILPGDSLLFAAGTLAGRGLLNPLLLFAVLSAAAILGDTVNYWVGKYLGEHFVRGRGRRWIKQEQRMEQAAPCESSRGEEERVSGKDGRHDQTGLGEDDQE